MSFGSSMFLPKAPNVVPDLQETLDQTLLNEQMVLGRKDYF